jgi:hypothetical protein
MQVVTWEIARRWGLPRARHRVVIAGVCRQRYHFYNEEASHFGVT